MSEFPEVCEQVENKLAQFTIGFVKFNDLESDAKLAGSGTLVSCGSSFAILTADHVIENLSLVDPIGVVVPVGGSSLGRRHRVTLDMRTVRRLTIGQASHSHSGPDLGLLMLSPPDAAKLQNWQSFYNLAKRRDSMLFSPPSIEDGGWFLAGFVDELTTEHGAESGFTKVMGFRGLCGAGVVFEGAGEPPFDYLNFEVKYDETVQGPISFEGSSGGGLWQVRFRKVDNRIEIADALLSGVAFYQSDRRNDQRIIYCHGRHSIYGTVCETLS
ncbi:MAG: hypothetical protein R3F45_05280 [Gammaproteobacteria bacterium]